MDIRTGQIYSPEQASLLSALDRAYLKEMEIPPTPEQKAKGKVGRNHPCPCNSGKKFKHCCLLKVESAKRNRD